MSEEAKRYIVREYLDLHPDKEFRRAVFALLLLDKPEHLDTLYDMAVRFGMCGEIVEGVFI